MDGERVENKVSDDRRRILLVDVPRSYLASRSVRPHRRGRGRGWLARGDARMEKVRRKERASERVGR